MTFYSQTVKQMTDRLYRNAYQTDRAIRARKFIDKNFDKPIFLDTIASSVFCSKFHLNREFRRHYGITPSKYLTDKRVAEAKRILQDNGSVTDACFSVGYESLSTFSLLFRRMTGENAESFKKARIKK